MQTGQCTNFAQSNLRHTDAASVLRYPYKVVPCMFSDAKKFLVVWRLYCGRKWLNSSDKTQNIDGNNSETTVLSEEFLG